MHEKDKDKNFYITAEIPFKCLFFLQFCQEPYSGPNQKPMVEPFFKNSQRLLTVNFFRKKAPKRKGATVFQKHLCCLKKQQIILCNFRPKKSSLVSGNREVKNFLSPTRISHMCARVKIFFVTRISGNKSIIFSALHNFINCPVLQT